MAAPQRAMTADREQLERASAKHEQARAEVEELEAVLSELVELKRVAGPSEGVLAAAIVDVRHRLELARARAIRSYKMGRAAKGKRAEVQGDWLGMDGVEAVRQLYRAMTKACLEIAEERNQ